MRTGRSGIDWREIGRVEVVVAVVLVGDVDVVAGPHVVPDLDRQVADDAAAAPDQAAVADAHHRVGDAPLARHHPRRQRDVRPDHRAAPMWM